MSCSSVNIIVGTYNDFIVGYQLHAPPNIDQRDDKTTSSKPDKKQTQNGKQDLGVNRKFELEQGFAIRAHSGAVKALESSKKTKFLVSAGSDEIINLYALEKNRLAHTFEGAMNCFEFIDTSHLIAGSEDSNIYIYNLERKQQKSLNLMKIFKGHKKSVTAISVHPSNKLFLSISKDNTMRTWNLVNGRPAFVTNIKHESHLIKWSPSGDKFVIAAENEIHLFKTEDGSRDFSTRFEKRVNALEFTADVSSLVIATDDGKITFLSMKTKTELHSFKAHDARCKALRMIDNFLINRNEEDDSSTQLLVTCSTDGTITVWDLASATHKKDPAILASTSIGARITCMTTNCMIENKILEDEEGGELMDTESETG